MTISERLDSEILKSLSGRDFTRLMDFSLSELEAIIDLAKALKTSWRDGQSHSQILPGRTLFMLFMNPSMRTRNSFEAGMFQLGGHAHFLQPSATRRPAMEGDETPYLTERVSDVARTLEKMGDAIAIRALGEAVQWDANRGFDLIQEFAKWASIPVINMEDNLHHPCQGLADLMTLKERISRSVNKPKIAICWTYSTTTSKPVAPQHDFLYICSLLGADITFARPKEMRIDSDIEQAARENVLKYGGSYQVVDDLEAACEGADFVYGRNFVCLDLLPPGQPGPQHEEMAKLFSSYSDWTIDETMMMKANPEAQFLHCLPCDRGHEVSSGVMDGKWGKTVFEQAGNRLHTQKAMLAAVVNFDRAELDL